MDGGIESDLRTETLNMEEAGVEAVVVVGTMRREEPQPPPP